VKYTAMLDQKPLAGWEPTHRGAAEVNGRHPRVWWLTPRLRPAAGNRHRRQTGGGKTAAGGSGAPPTSPTPSDMALGQAKPPSEDETGARVTSQRRALLATAPPFSSRLPLFRLKTGFSAQAGDGADVFGGNSRGVGESWSSRRFGERRRKRGPSRLRSRPHPDP